jgi:hypothetical protein
MEHSIREDVERMIALLEWDRGHGPYMMYLPDEMLIAWGRDPNDYPELEGHPGIRVVIAK